MKRILYVFVGLLIFVSCVQRRPDSVYYLPESLKGWVIVFFLEPTGKSVEKDGNRNVYRIPADGVLVLNSRPDYGFASEFVYIVTQDGRSIPIAKWSKPIQILARQDGSVKEEGLGRKVDFRAFFVGTEAELRANPLVDDEVRNAIKRIRR